MRNAKLVAFCIIATVFFIGIFAEKNETNSYSSHYQLNSPSTKGILSENSPSNITFSNVKITYPKSKYFPSMSPTFYKPPSLNSFYDSFVTTTTAVNYFLPKRALMSAASLSAKPSSKRTVAPTKKPSRVPTQRDTGPSRFPSQKSSWSPTKSPSMSPTDMPSKVPSKISTKTPSILPTKSITNFPSKLPTKAPTSNLPSKQFPSRVPSILPSFYSTQSPSITSSLSPTKSSSLILSQKPSKVPSTKPSPRNPTATPSAKDNSNQHGPPSMKPSLQPTRIPRSDDITYHNNGSVMVGPINIYHIFMGSFSPTTVSLMNYFAQNIGSSSLFDVLGEYSQTINGVKTSIPTKASNRVNFMGNWTYMPKLKKKFIYDSDIFNAFTSNINKAVNPMPLDPVNGIYILMLRGDFTYRGWNNPKDPQGYCGFHSCGYLISTIPVKFALVGDPSNSIPRNDGCIFNGNNNTLPNGDMGADSMVTTYAHELAEIITDNDCNTWYRDKDADTGGEIGDICGIEQSEISKGYNIEVGEKRFLVQYFWQPGVGCVLQRKQANSAGSKPSQRPVAQPTISPAMSYELTYHSEGQILTDGSGGPVYLHNIYLGELGAATTHLMDYFARHVGNTDWYKVLTSYYHYSPSFGQQFVSNYTEFAGNYSIYPAQRSMVLNETDIETLLVTAISSGNLSADSMGVYTVMFRGDFTVSFRGKLWLRDWCSFHGAFLAEPLGLVVKYAVIGDPSTVAADQRGLAAGCQPVSGRPTANGDLGADSMVTGYAQQLAQTVTDSQSNAWYSESDGKEVGSACEGDFGPGFSLGSQNSNVQFGDKRFLVQSLWQRGVGCTMRRRSK